jgi:hypothetical protein
MTTTAWDHLPNKMYIDQLFEDLAKHQDLFLQAYNLEYDQAYYQARKQARNQARDQVCDQARKQAWDQARNQAYDQAWDQARVRARVQAWDQVFYVARDALLILIAYDDASKYLTIPIDQAMVYGELLSDNQYILLKQYLLVKHEIALLATA